MPTYPPTHERGAAVTTAPPALDALGALRHTKRMWSTRDDKTSPIEVWLTQQNLKVKCMVVREDETTYELDVDSLSIRGAQREITGHFLDQGYAPDGRWELASDADAMDGPIESTRRFKPPAPA